MVNLPVDAPFNPEPLHDQSEDEPFDDDVVVQNINELELGAQEII
jgi:hypothetical protein